MVVERMWQKYIVVDYKNEHSSSLFPVSLALQYDFAAPPSLYVIFFLLLLNLNWSVICLGQ